MVNTWLEDHIYIYIYIYIYNFGVSIIDRQIIIGFFVFPIVPGRGWSLMLYFSWDARILCYFKKLEKKNTIYVSNKTWLQVLVYIFCLANFSSQCWGSGVTWKLFFGELYIYNAQKFLGVSWVYILDKINCNLHWSSYMDIMKLGFWCEGLTCTFLNINLYNWTMFLGCITFYYGDQWSFPRLFGLKTEDLGSNCRV